MRPERIIQAVAMAIVIAGAVTSVAGQVLREQFHIEPAAVVQRLADGVHLHVRIQID